MIYKLSKNPFPQHNPDTTNNNVDKPNPSLSILLKAPTVTQDGSLTITYAGYNNTNVINISNKSFVATYDPKITSTTTTIYYVQYLKGGLKFFDTIHEARFKEWVKLFKFS